MSIFSETAEQEMSNIYDHIPEKLPDELFEKITSGGSFLLQRIVSKGHCTPKGEWYDQNEDEWVILLKGSAGILMEGETTARVLSPGDHLVLPARVRHRVEWTDAEVETVWLALHYAADTDKPKG